MGRPDWWLVLEGFWNSLVQLVVLLFSLLPVVLPILLWIVWWLWGVNWKKAWPVLARGAWAPLVLLMLVITQVWSLTAPSDCDCLRFLVIPNYWWQLGSVATLVAIALFCGWLQLVMGWSPEDIPVEPAPADHGLHHEHVEHH
jgi:hypothetical protein